jgi:hypothetical protein
MTGICSRGSDTLDQGHVLAAIIFMDDTTIVDAARSLSANQIV